MQGIGSARSMKRGAVPIVMCCPKKKKKIKKKDAAKSKNDSKVTIRVSAYSQLPSLAQNSQRKSHNSHAFLRTT